MTAAKAPPPAPPEDGWQAEEWIFAGLRIDGPKASDRWHRWIGPDGTERRYSEKRAARYVIGGAYEVLVNHAPDGTIWRRGAPAFSRVDDAARDRYEPDDKIAQIRAAGYARERDAKRQSALDDALQPLLRIAGRYRTRDTQDALAAHVLGELSRAWITHPPGTTEQR